MRNYIQQMAYRMQVEVQAKESEAVLRAVQRFYGCDYSVALINERTVYIIEGGYAVLRDKETNKPIIMIHPYTTITHDYGVTLQASYLTFDGKK